MWSVEQPQFDTARTYQECVHRIREPELRERMLAVEPLVVERCADYDRRIVAGEMHLVEVHEEGLGEVSGVELIGNYILRMARKGAPARAIYDAIKILPRNNRCPFCGYGAVETLDHFLPKRLYPAFAVKPTNLVGCCDRCNRLKGEAAPLGPVDGFLHPYFDDVNYATWLEANVVQSAPVAATFRVGDPKELDVETISRVRSQFVRLNLSDLYSDAAADLIVDVQEELNEIFLAGGAASVSTHLARRCASVRRSNLNSWTAALYAALAESAWYCSGGFRNVP